MARKYTATFLLGWFVASFLLSAVYNGTPATEVSTAEWFLIAGWVALLLLAAIGVAYDSGKSANSEDNQ